MTINLGRGLASRIAFQSAIDTYAEGPWFPVRTYKRADPASPDLSDDPLLGDSYDNKRDAIAPLVGMPKGDVSRTVPMALAEMGMYLCAAFGFSAVSGTTGAYTHVFKSGADTLPYLTMQDKLGGTMFRRHRGVVVDGFSLQATKENAYPQLVLDLLMRDSAMATDWLSGDLNDAMALERPTAWTAIAKWNDTAIGEAMEATVNYKNNCDRSMLLSGDEFPVSIDPMLAAAGGSMKLRLLSDTYHTLAANGGAPGKLSLIWKLASSPTTRSLQIDINNCRLSANGQPVEGAGEITSDFTIRGEQGASTHPMMTVTLKNGIDTYEPE